eukprot:g28656.t1
MQMQSCWKSAEEILELWSSGKLEASHAVTAFFLLGKAVRGQQRPLTKLSRSDPAFVNLVAALRLQLPSLRGKDLSNVWLGARDSRVGDLEFLEELGKVTQQKAASLVAQAIANILNSMTNLQYNPGEAVLRTLCGKALKKADSFNAQEIANTLNAFAKLDHHPGEAVLRTLCGEALKKADSRSSAEDLCGEALKKADSFEAQEIANTLNAFANLDHQPGEAVLRTLCGEALKKANLFKAQEIANTLNAFANLDHHPGEAELRTLCGEVLKKADSFNAQAIANTLHAFAKLDHQPGEAVLRTLCGEALKKADSFKAQEIANTLNAFGLVQGAGDCEHFERVCKSRSSPRRSSAEDVAIANTLHAFAKLDHQPGEAVLRTLCGEALKKADSFDAQAIANTLHACVVLDRVDPALFSRLLAQLFKSRVMLNPLEMRQLHYVHLSLRWEHPSMGLALPASLADACKLSLRASQSKVQGVPHDNEKNASGLCQDICLNEHKLVIEVDGPTHFVTATLASSRPIYNSITLCKQRLLRAMGWRVVSVPFFEWGALGPSERGSYMRQKLLEVR